MRKEEYTNILSNIDIEIDNLVMDYSRNERRWNLPDEEIPIRQEKIRELKHRKIMLNEGMLLTGGNPKLAEMLKPILLRRVHLKFDGQTFYFRTNDTEYKPKHLRGFWSCTGCMVDLSKGFEADSDSLKDLSIYNRQIEWCPKFMKLLSDKGPLEYERIIRKANPDTPICYAGLLHAELQTTATEVKLVKQCDTCSYQTIESKELAVEALDGMEVPVNDKAKDSTVISCRCTVCEEIIFEEFADRCTTTNSANDQVLTPEYEDKLNQHHSDKHQ